jgi:hypothetical protein
MKRSKRPLVKLSFIIGLSLLLTACEDEEGKQFFNRLVFQDVKQCTTYLTSLECNRLFDKIKNDLQSNKLDKFKIYDSFETCEKDYKNCEQIYEKYYAIPKYYAALLDKDYNELNNYVNDIQIIDYDVLYEKDNAIVAKDNQPIVTGGTNPIGFYYFGMFTSNGYGGTTSANNYYKQPVTTKSGSYIGNFGKPYSGPTSAIHSSSSVSRGGFAVSSSSSS